MSFEIILDRLFDYYNVNSIIDLADKMEVSQPAISKWKARNSLNAVKKKCRELGIYKEIFENTQTPSTSQITKGNINAKLFLFERRSLMYLYYLLQKQNINNAIDYFSWQSQKDEGNAFKNFLDDMWHDKSNDNLSFSFYRSEADQFISLFIDVDELDYIFNHKNIFLESIISMATKKIGK